MTHLPMALDYPFFLVNCKLYAGTAGAEGLAFANQIETVQDRTGARFVVAPQTPDIRLFAEHTSLSIVAQSVTAIEPGRGTGQIAIDT
ncbi:MAG: triose-phosphate isomerase, partial [Halobacteriota archaeon]